MSRHHPLLLALFLFVAPALLGQTDLQLEFGSINGTGCPGVGPCNPPPFQLYPGGKSGFGATMRNLGPSPASNVVLTITFPSGVTIENMGAFNVTCNTAQTPAATILTCTAPSFPVAFAAASITFSARLPDNYPCQTPFVATATLIATTPDPVPANNTMTDTQQVFPPPIPALSDLLLGLLFSTFVVIGIVRARK
jgi:uncharacterized repeat protein (TIGR01451 family)